jgi:hypothetical protein
LKGNDLKAYFDGKEVRTIFISGNAETLYYPLEEDGTKVGMNETQSPYLRFRLKDNKMDELAIWPGPRGKMTPIPDLQPDQKILKGFYWYDYLRPLDKDDIFREVKMKTEDTPQRSNRFNISFTE